MTALGVLVHLAFALTTNGVGALVIMVGVFGGMVLGQALGGLIAQAWGLTAPWWFAFAGSALTLAVMWRQISHIAAARPALGEDAATA